MLSMSLVMLGVYTSCLIANRGLYCCTGKATVFHNGNCSFQKCGQVPVLPSQLPQAIEVQAATTLSPERLHMLNILQDAAPLLQWSRCGQLSHLSAGGDAMHSVCGWVSFSSLAPSLAFFSWSGPWASLNDGLVPPWDSVSCLNFCLVVSVPFLWFLRFLTSLSSHPLSMSSCLSWSNCSQPGCHSHRWPLLWQTLL